MLRELLRLLDEPTARTYFLRACELDELYKGEKAIFLVLARQVKEAVRMMREGANLGSDSVDKKSYARYLYITLHFEDAGMKPAATLHRWIRERKNPECWKNYEQAIRVFTCLIADDLWAQPLS